MPVQRQSARRQVIPEKIPTPRFPSAFDSSESEFEEYFDEEGNLVRAEPSRENANTAATDQVEEQNSEDESKDNSG